MPYYSTRSTQIRQAAKLMENMTNESHEELKCSLPPSFEICEVCGEEIVMVYRGFDIFYRRRQCPACGHEMLVGIENREQIEYVPLWKAFEELHQRNGGKNNGS